MNRLGFHLRDTPKTRQYPYYSPMFTLFESWCFRSSRWVSGWPFVDCKGRFFCCFSNLKKGAAPAFLMTRDDRWWPVTRREKPWKTHTFCCKMKHTDTQITFYFNSFLWDVQYSARTSKKKEKHLREIFGQNIIPRTLVLSFSGQALLAFWVPSFSVKAFECRMLQDLYIFIGHVSLVLIHV